MQEQPVGNGEEVVVEVVAPLLIRLIGEGHLGHVLDQIVAELQLCFETEINARYSMGWAVGMGAVRPDLE